MLPLSFPSGRWSDAEARLLRIMAGGGNPETQRDARETETDSKENESPEPVKKDNPTEGARKEGERNVVAADAAQERKGVTAQAYFDRFTQILDQLVKNSPLYQAAVRQANSWRESARYKNGNQGNSDAYIANVDKQALAIEQGAERKAKAVLQGEALDLTNKEMGAAPAGFKPESVPEPAVNVPGGKAIPEQPIAPPPGPRPVPEPSVPSLDAKTPDKPRSVTDANLTATEKFQQAEAKMAAAKTGAEQLAAMAEYIAVIMEQVQGFVDGISGVKKPGAAPDAAKDKAKADLAEKLSKTDPKEPLLPRLGKQMAEDQKIVADLKAKETDASGKIQGLEAKLATDKNLTDVQKKEITDAIPQMKKGLEHTVAQRKAAEARVDAARSMVEEGVGLNKELRDQLRKDYLTLGRQNPPISMRMGVDEKGMMTVELTNVSKEMRASMKVKAPEEPLSLSTGAFAQAMKDYRGSTETAKA